MISPAMQTLIMETQDHNPGFRLVRVGAKPALLPKDVPASVLPTHTASYSFAFTRNHAYRRAGECEKSAALTSKRIVRGHNEAVEYILSSDLTMTPARFWDAQHAAHNRRKAYAGKVTRGVATYDEKFYVDTVEMRGN